MMALRSINRAESQTCSAYPGLSRQLIHRGPAAASRPTARLQRRYVGTSAFASASASAASAYRRDLDPNGPYSSSPIYEYGGSGLGQAKALMPSFDPKDQGAPISQTIPILPTMTIKKVKAAAMDVLRENPDTTAIATTYDRLRKVDSTSSFIHPAGLAGPAELSMMLYRIKQETQPTITARDSLLSGP